MGIPIVGTLGKRIFGTRNERMVKRLLRIVDQVSAREVETRTLSDQQLRAKTDEFRKRIADGEKPTDMIPEVFAIAREAMDRNVGGEQSGHIILSDHATTGDGLVAGLQVLAALVETGKVASELLHMFEPVPQLLRNVRFNGGTPLDDERVKLEIASAETELGECGRLVIRKSGTEPLIRVMAEGDDPVMVERLVGRICDAVAAA